MNRRKRSIISGVLVLTLSLGMALNVNATTIEDAQKKADELESKKNSAQAEKNSLTEQLNGIVKEMNTAQEKLTKKQEEIQTAEQELLQAKVDENSQYQSMKKRIKYMYENGNTQFLEILIESENIGDFLNKAEYVSQISTYDRNMLIEFQDTVKAVEEKEESLQAEYTELTKLQNELLAKQTEVETLLSDKNVQLADLEAQIGENAATLQALIAQAEEEKRKQEEAAAAAAAAAVTNSGGGGGSSYIPSTSTPVVSGNGQFTHPCPGMTYQSSYFGEIREFEYGGHKGNDYAAPTGTPTYAAAAGTVLYARWSDSAGNWVVIDHGNGLVTKYMHHSAYCVSEGQYVEKGQQIGYVGSTGQSTGPHLHFQVEVNGVAVSPDLYL